MKKYCAVILAAVLVFSAGTFLKCYSKEKDYYQIAAKMGYDVEKTPSEVADVIIPKEFGKVYIRYNSLQMEGGFNLEKYKGKRCKRYTYQIPSINARANVLVYNNVVIGGDISGITIDGIMIPLQKEKLYAN